MLETWTLEHIALVAADLGAWTWDVQADSITWSERTYALYGVRPGEFDGTLPSFMALIDPREREYVSRRLEQALTSGDDEWELEHRVIGPSPERWLSCKGRVVRDAQGRPIRMAGVVHDVSRQRSAKQAQEETAGLMRAALDASLFAVVVLEPDGRIIYCNAYAAELLGLSRASVESRSYNAPQWKHTDVDGDSWPDEKQPFVRVMRTGEAVRGVEHRIERPDGRSFLLHVNAAPIKDPSGEIRLVVTSFEDVTERRALEESSRHTQKLEAMGRLAGGVAHDFNNLLTVIVSFAELAQRNPKNTELLAASFENIKAAAERATRLTRQLLAFGRRDATRPITFDARTEVGASIRMLERVVGEGIVLEYRPSPEAAWLHMDPGQLNQILVNLALNARDAMGHGGRLTFAMSIVGGPRGGRLRLVVADNGEGMDEATRLRAFEPFFTTKPAYEGTGLGLATCQSIVDAVQGSISIESEIGRGTRVIVELPLAKPSVPQAKELVLVGTTRAAKARVLVVEDDPGVRAAAVRSLEANGLEVHAAANADEALNLTARAVFDVVVCDIILPGMSGPELLARVRAERPETRALFVSGYGVEARVGGEEFLAKPYSPEKLVARTLDLLTRDTPTERPRPMDKFE